MELQTGMNALRAADARSYGSGRGEASPKPEFRVGAPQHDALSSKIIPRRFDGRMLQFAKVALVKVFPLPLPANAFLVPNVGFEDLP
jgi:hypothetical protein